MGSSGFYSGKAADYKVVDKGSDGSGFFDGPAYTEINPVAVTALATQAAASAAASGASATSSASSASAALASQTAAATSETNAAASATGADASEAEATAQAAIATTQAGNAATSAAAALVSEGNASDSETAAASSASAALASEGSASTSETNAGTSETNAAASAAAALASETNAAAAVQAAKGTATPLVDGVAAVGAGVKWAKEDHVHPTDTSRAPLASPALTGTPTAPTAAASDDSTTIATTAHVKSNFGAWTAYTPSVSAGAGTFTSASATGRYREVGKTVFFNLTVTIATNGTAASSVVATLPVAAKSVCVFFGREDAVTGAVFQAKSAAASTSVNMFTFSNTYPGGSGYQLVISGSYEAN